MICINTQINCTFDVLLYPDSISVMYFLYPDSLPMRYFLYPDSLSVRYFLYPDILPVNSFFKIGIKHGHFIPYGVLNIAEIKGLMEYSIVILLFSLGLS